jgi:hypothetical protein
MARRSTTVSHNPDETDELERGRRWPVRYLVAWMPWLRLIKGLQDEEFREKQKRWSEQSTCLSAGEKINFAQPPRRGESMESSSVPESIGGGVAVRHGETI